MWSLAPGFGRYFLLSRSLGVEPPFLFPTVVAGVVCMTLFLKHPCTVLVCAADPARFRSNVFAPVFAATDPNSNHVDFGFYCYGSSTIANALMSFTTGHSDYRGVNVSVA